MMRFQTKQRTTYKKNTDDLIEEKNQSSERQTEIGRSLACASVI